MTLRTQDERSTQSVQEIVRFRKTIRINTNDCIGCGICSQLSPNNFQLNHEQGIASVTSQEFTSSVKEAIDSCPVSAITYE